MLAKDVKMLAADDGAEPDLRALAQKLAEQYKYPVDFQVVDTDGTLHAQGEANKMRRSYWSVLQEGLP